MTVTNSGAGVRVSWTRCEGRSLMIEKMARGGGQCDWRLE